jgi:hypothetical protein
MPRVRLSRRDTVIDRTVTIVLAIAAPRAHARDAGTGWGFTCERQACMTIRSRRETVTFRHPFRMRGIDRVLPAGAYEVVTDEETIEGLTFAAYRRIATMITVPAEGAGGVMEMLPIGSVDLANAQAADASIAND